MFIRNFQDGVGKIFLSIQQKLKFKMAIVKNSLEIILRNFHIKKKIANFKKQNPRKTNNVIRSRAHKNFKV